jgi:predicted deacylase
VNTHMATAKAAPSRVWATLDLQRDGKEAGYLRVPHSIDGSAYGTIPVPIVRIRNGEGPTALLVAGSHGDEYEGQVGLSRLARLIQPRDLRGCILVLPHLNLPAARAGRRLSPLDEGNLNRLFPGDANGGPTAMLAHYVASVLLPLASVVLDLHSGGCSLDYVGCSLIRATGRADEDAQMKSLARAFGAPICSISDGSGGGGATTLSAAAQALGIPALTTELGGGSGLSRLGVRLAEEGTLRLLHHVGILREEPAFAAGPVRFMEVPARDAYIYAAIDGIFEPVVEVGATVAGDALGGFIHPLPDADPVPVSISRSGLIGCRRAIALTKEGDCLFKILTDVAP